MIASKEQAKKAAEALARGMQTVGDARVVLVGPGQFTLPIDAYVIVADFIAAAEKRLPSAAAIEKDRIRKKIFHETRRNRAQSPQGVPA